MKAIGKREIKFRAWDKESLKMIEIEGLDLEGWIWNYNRYTHLANLKFMQFTGLKDKNGKEIYEGDIIKKTKSISGDFIGEVVYRSSQFMIRHFDGKIEIHDPFPPEDECPLYLKVLGNIYEDENLLNK